MDYEKKYNEALERAQKATRAGSDVAMDIVQYIFPELAESEDERIINAIIGILKNSNAIDINVSQEKMLAWLEKQKESLYIPETCKENADSFTDGDERIRKEILAFVIDMDCKESWIHYLEKQKEQNLIMAKSPQLKEQKPAEWSEEDEDRIRQIERIAQQAGCTQKLQEEIHDWLKSLRPVKQEWDTYDKAIVKCIVCCLDGQFVTEAARKQALEWFNKHRRDFLNSPSWKPSEEQMEVLKEAVFYFGDSWIGKKQDNLESLYEQLKKLM